MFNTKRALALALAGTMAVSNFAVASASELTTSDKLDVLMDLEVIFGDSSDPDSLKLDTEMERYRSVALMLRLTEDNLHDAMLEYDYEGQPSFADAGEFSTYVERLVAFTYNNEVGIHGYEDGTFRPLATMTDQAYAKIMLESLGYTADVDYTWETVAELAEEVGIVEDAASITNTTAQFGEIVELTYETLATESKDESITLGEKIGKPVVSSNLEVAAVEALNLKQVKVSFSTAVDEESATDEANYSLEADNASLTDASFELVSDNEVVITFGTEAHQQDAVTLTVEDVEAVNGKVLAETDVEVSFLDQTIPTVEGIEVVGNETLKVTFSEPMKSVAKANFEIKEGSKKLYIDDVTNVNDEMTEFYVTLYNDLNEGEIAVTVDDAEDFAGFNVIKDTISVDVAIDEEAPEVVSYKDATPNKVTLEFSEDIELQSNDIDDFYHTNSKNTVADMADVEVEGNELTLTFADDSKLPEGIAYIYVNEEAISDLWGNENDQVMIQVEVDLDETAPVVEEVEVDTEERIIVKFDEELDQTSAEDDDNYTLVDSEGEEADLIDDITYADKEVTITFDEKLSGEYVLFIEEVEDLSGNEVDTEIEFDVDDLTKPVFTDFSATLYNANTEDQILKIAFDEKMAEEGKYSVTDEEKFIIGDEELTDIEDAYIEVVDGGKAIEIHVSNEAKVLDDTMDVTIARVADAAGNATAALSGVVAIDAAGTVAITDVEATAKNTIEVTFDDKLTDVEPNDLSFSTASYNVAISSVSVSEDDDDNTVITYTTAEDLTTDGLFKTEAIIVTVSGNTSENQYGEKIDASVPAFDDMIAPEVAVDGDDNAIVVDDADTNTVTITFTENLDATHEALISTDLVVTVNGDELVAGVDFETTVSGTDLEIEITTAEGIVVGDDVEISLDSTVNYLTDGETAVEELELSLEVQ